MPAPSPGPLPVHTAPARSRAACSHHPRVPGACRVRFLVAWPQPWPWGVPRTAGLPPELGTVSRSGSLPRGLPGSVAVWRQRPCLLVTLQSQPRGGGTQRLRGCLVAGPPVRPGEGGPGGGSAHSPPAGDAAAPLDRGTSRATSGAAGRRSPRRPTPSPCSAWPARCPAASCTCTATTTCTGEGGAGSPGRAPVGTLWKGFC